eukprot:snap_masked-scaffold430_size173499-processed-gene-0.6 protein:Tk06994 transcript:snap_masked-scaffold430_size173499-processed-gene-0.6-mRNA-1 annotation:"erythroblast macrophage protein emp"
MADIRSLEHPTLKVPYEMLNKRFRGAQKTIERETAHAGLALNALERNLHSPENVADLAKSLHVLVERMEHFQSKSEEAVQSELAVMENLKQRLAYLKGGCGTDPSNAPKWRKTRVDRMLVEHFLRSGFYNTAIKLARVAEIDDLTNINLFLVAKEVEEALLKRDTSKCLTWCHDHRSKMRKMHSTLEFNIRLQEFIELIKQNRQLDAVKHARKFLSTTEHKQMATVQRGMALLAFPPGTRIQPYADMFRESRWQALIEQFRAENYRLFQLSNQSVFSVALQAGLSSLKTQKCYTDQPNFECPVCQEPLNALAEHLPFAHCSQSRLICYITGKPLNENNQPLMLPNGYVYGEEALTRMALESDGQVVCPRTKEIYALVEAQKVFVM